jgi:riboflavin biosynthesis pyrimidine reductase
MTASAMPTGWFDVLIEDPVSEGAGLPTGIRNVYGGDWKIATQSGRPYLYVNFVVSRDGRVSFSEPGSMGGGAVSKFDRRDQWLMGLLRARADAILVGDATVRVELDHVWTAGHIFPEDEAAFGALREAERRREQPLLVILSLDGDVPTDAASLTSGHTLVSTTKAGARRLRGNTAGIEVLELGEAAVDVARLVTTLAERFGVRTLLCEGGPRVYASLLRSGLGFDEFLTLSPIMIGADERRRRPSLVEGAAFVPGTAPSPTLLSVRRGGDYLYLRSRYPGLGA